MKKKQLALIILCSFFLITFFSCKKSEEAQAFDIRGTWSVEITFDGPSGTGAFTFSGTLTNGTVTGTVDGVTSTGTYNVNDRTITLALDQYDDSFGNIQYTGSGTALDNNNIEGTVVALFLDQNNQEKNGTWSCNR